MRRRIILLLPVFALLFVQFAVYSEDDPQIWRGRNRFPRLPGGKSQEQLIVEAHLKSNLEDADEILLLSKEIEESAEGRGPQINRDELRKKAERIEKLAKSIRGRLKWF